MARRISAIRDAKAETMVRVRGRIRAAAGTFAAPLSGMPVVAYHSVIVGDTSSGARRLVEEQLAKDFAVEDGTGALLVRAAAAARIRLAADRRWDERDYPALSAAPPLWQRAYESKTPATVLTAWEGFLEEGAFVDVTGWCHLEPDPNPPIANLGYREMGGMRAVLIAPRRGRLWITNQSAPGKPRIEPRYRA
jgi:hypothetical protein